MNRAIIYIAGLLLTTFLLWFGFAMLLFEEEPTAPMLVVMGLASLVASLFAVSAQIKHRVALALVIGLIGIYFFARANGTIEGHWLLRISGIAAITAALIIFWIAFMQVPKKNDRPVEGDRPV